MKNSVLIIAALSTLIFTSCNKEKWPYCIKANGKISEETRALSSFDEVEFDIPGNLYITQSSDIKTPEIRIVTSDNLIERIDTDVEGDKLVIHNEKCIRKMKDFDAYLIVKDINVISLNGSGNIICQNQLDAERLTVEINGSGDVKLDAVTTSTYIDINGSGDVKSVGSSNDLGININGSGDIHAFETEVSNAYIDINGSGNCEVNVIEFLDVNISGSGDVIYEGSPKVQIQNSGSGSVRSR